MQKSFRILGNSDELREIIETIDQVAKTDITILILGESGTGKELIANAIHRHSLRKHQPLVKVNCGAIPAGIIESELFGHVKGSFTGAIEHRKGYFESANNGTIFLDEIGEMPLETQVKLLRVLELGEFLPVGGSEIKRTDVRIIAATNKDLSVETEKERFRKDLYYRLKTITISLPPLRKHPEDIPIFVNKFAIDFANKNSIVFKGFSPNALNLLMKYHWPGNTRELKNFVESMIVLQKGEVINSKMIEKRLFVERRTPSSNLPMKVSKSVDQAERELILHQILLLRRESHEIKNILSGKFAQTDFEKIQDSDISHHLFPVQKEERFIEEEVKTEEKENYIINPNILGTVSFEEVERELIEKTLKKFNFKKRQTANSLKISERTLYRKIKEYGL
ncbi:MAG: sigma-54-dependent Fis family transcriptional regulator [Candidatus Neomarinimicrobiota bacterium]|nr:MAG: sigma-54-dependent Fis family transcriptional regulator [Candidatus Neomarinimicrobiota bacterium]